MLRSMRSVVVVFLVAVVAALVGGVLSAASTSLAREPHPYISPTVCQTGGTCFEVDNTGHGIAITGSVTANHAKGLLGVSQSTSSGGQGVNGQSYGPSSVAINGIAFSTDPTHPSVGVDGESANGDGIKGITRFNSPLQISAAAGVSGADKSSQYPFDEGVFGSSTRGVGVAGVSSNGNAVTGSSTNGNGIVGQTSFFGTSGQGQAGVLGQDTATPGPFGTPTVNVGVYGSSAFGTGVYALSVSGTGIGAFSNTGTGLSIQSKSGSAIIASSGGQPATASLSDSGNGDVLDLTSNTGRGLVAVGAGNPEVFIGGSVAAPNSYLLDIDGNGIPGSTGILSYADQGIYSFGANGPALTAMGYPSSPVLLVEDPQGGASTPAPEVVVQGVQSANVMSLDQAGNMILAGSLTQNGNPMVAHRSRSGWGVGTYTAQEAQATVEDVGEADIVAGEGYVRLDAHFATLLDSHSSYLVFLTPQGDCRGLYATQKTLSGFYVRELQGGRSSIAFDYRVVAKPADSNGVRLPIVRPIERYRAPAMPPLHHAAPKLPKVQIPRVRTNYVPSH